MWKVNGKTTTLSLFLDCLFSKTEISYMRDVSSGDKNYPEVNYYPNGICGEGCF